MSFRFGNGGKPVGLPVRYEQQIIAGRGRGTLYTETATNVVSEAAPDTVFVDGIGPLQTSGGGTGKWVFKKVAPFRIGQTAPFTFTDMPDGIGRVVIATLTFTSPVAAAATTAIPFLVRSDYDPATLTWNNMPTPFAMAAGFSISRDTTVASPFEFGESINLDFSPVVTVYGFAFKGNNVDTVTDLRYY